jgi:hypothetical protein
VSVQEMAQQANRKVLICYSNPLDTPRLRLDWEYRAIEMILQENGIDGSNVKRLHATTVEDIARALRDDKYTLVHFSGHGTEDGIILQSPTSNASQLLTAANLAALLRARAGDLEGLVCMACFSAASIPVLVRAASYLITIQGDLPDDAAVEFVRVFYGSYFRSHSMRSAYELASFLLNTHDDSVSAVMSRRATYGKDEQTVYEVFGINSRPASVDSFCVDISAVEADLSGLAIQRDQFLTMLTRKIRVHSWIFEYPREDVLLQLGAYCGLFTWQNSADVIYCKRVMVIDPDADETLCEAWSGLIVSYNDHYMDAYRLHRLTGQTLTLEMLDDALYGYVALAHRYFDVGSYADAMRKAVPTEYKTSRSLFSAYLGVCQERVQRGDLAAAVTYLETMLSSLHDLIDAITRKVTLPSPR